MARKLPLLVLAGLVVVAAADPIEAPADPWRMLVEAPGIPTAEAVTADLLDRFLKDHGIRLRTSLKDSIASAVAECSLRHRIEPRLILSVILTESSFRTDVVSRKGAVGLMQLLPSTAAAVASELDLPWEKPSLEDPRVNIALGASYLTELIEMFDGDLDMALTAYNIGPTNLRGLLRRGELRRHRSGASSSYAHHIVSRLGSPETITAQAL